MVLKICFNNEMHRCSEPPVDLESLHSYLRTSFHASIPENFTLSYVNPENGQVIQIVTPNDYINLINLKTSKAVKVYVTGEVKTGEKSHQDDDTYSVIPKPNSQDINELEEVKTGEKKSNDKPSLEKIVKELSESTIIPQAEKKYAYFSYNSQQDDHVKKIVRETLEEQLPFIVAKVKALVISELKDQFSKNVVVVDSPVLQVHNPESQIHSKSPIKVVEVVDEPEFLKKEAIVLDHVVEEEEKKEEFNFEKHEEGDVTNSIRRMSEEAVESIKLKVEEKKGNFIKQIKSIGTAVKDSLDGLAQKVVGDPYVVIEEGKYPKSVVEKAEKLREVFLDQDKKTLLDFVAKWPRDTSLPQLAHMLIVKDEPPVVEEQNQVVQPVDEVI